MRQKINEHILSIVLVSIILVGLMIYLRANGATQLPGPLDREAQNYMELDFFNDDSPFDKALLADLLDIYHPERQQHNDSLLAAIDFYQSRQLQITLQNAHQKQSLGLKKLGQIIGMYLKFIVIFIAVMLLTYYGVQTTAILRFMRKKQQRSSYLVLLMKHLKMKPTRPGRSEMMHFVKTALFLFFKACARGFAYFVLFSPAYVIAYSFKTDFGANSTLFMIFLAVVSNGLLINYSNKFYTFLISESRKGYVQTAIVKNLHNSYGHTRPVGIPYKYIFRWNKKFPGHVFDHIFMNARHQYIPTIKEQASFLITGLIIIEMALNIHGHLTYELLQQLLYKNYDIVIAIVLGIFWLVKATEIFSDVLLDRQKRKIANE